MSDMRKVIVSGRLTWDAREEFTRTGKKIARLGIACQGWRGDGNGGGEEFVDFFNVTVFLRDNDKRLALWKKGEFVEVKGQLRQQRWEKDGKKLSRVYISVQHINVKFDRNPNHEEPVFTEEATHINLEELTAEALEEPPAESDTEYF